MFRKLVLIMAILGFAAAPAFAGDAAKGAELFKKQCKACHGNDGSTKGPLSKPIKPTPEEKTIAALDGKGEGLDKKYALMVKTLAKKNFTDEQKADLAAFLAE